MNYDIEFICLLFLSTNFISISKNLSARAEYELLAENKELKFWTNETIASILFLLSCVE